ncbi:MAG: HAMP domain-containing histidine kinase [candidate division KSB1 bacterium]|nr:HAMP domain-containing histidine kinase [candidate division KSB1 bacterium]
MINAIGIAFLCEPSGIVRQVLRNTFATGAEDWIGRPFPTFAVKGSVEKALSFLNEIKQNGAAFDWAINVQLDDKVQTLHFAGGMLGETLLIVGAPNGRFAAELYEEMLRMNNEQTNALRQALKAIPMEKEQLLDEISRLNNELVAMQRELAKKNAELRQLNEEKNRFLGMAAHDLRNPLHAVLAYSDFLMEHLADDKSREFLQVIRNSSLFMARLIDDLLDVAKIESGHLQLEYTAFDLADLIRQNAAVHRFVAERKNVLIEYNLEPIWMVGDAAKLQQVLNNLIRNAVKFSYPQGRVEVTVHRLDGEAELIVRDYGVGMSAKEQANLFKPFSRGKQGTDGEKSTGLGLMIVKRIIEGHGGTIKVESREGEGTSFRIILPLKPKEN